MKDVCPFCSSPAVFDIRLDLKNCSKCRARETVHGWQKSTWGVCSSCGHDAVVSDPGRDIDICLDCGAHQTD
jgi:ribosomal protein L37AE/L43A